MLLTIETIWKGLKWQKSGIVLYLLNKTAMERPFYKNMNDPLNFTSHEQTKVFWTSKHNCWLLNRFQPSPHPPDFFGEYDRVMFYKFFHSFHRSPVIQYENETEFTHEWSLERVSNLLKSLSKQKSAH